MKNLFNSHLPIVDEKRICEELPCDELINEKSSLLPAKFEHLKKSQKKMDDLSRSDWENLSNYRKIYNREQQAKQALSMLEIQKDAPSYGFRINN